MSRSQYNEDCENVWVMIRYRGAVAAATKGSRGQRMLRDLLAALDAMPVKRLVKEALEHDGEVCALGCLGRVKGIDMTQLDPEESDGVAQAFGIAPALAREIVYENDEGSLLNDETPEQCWARMRRWVERQIFDKRGNATI